VPRTLLGASTLEGAMTSKSCRSENLRNFNGELAIHFSRLARLDKPVVGVFPQLLVV